MKKKVEKVVCNFSFIWQFAIDDFKMKYAGSGLGTLWAFYNQLLLLFYIGLFFKLGLNLNQLKTSHLFFGLSQVWFHGFSLVSLFRMQQDV